MGYQQALKKFGPKVSPGPVVMQFSPPSRDTADSPEPSPEAESGATVQELTQYETMEETGPVIPEWLGTGIGASREELRDLQQHGTRPKSFSKAVICKQCGPVWEEVWVDDNPEVCRWCFRAYKGEIPRPNQKITALNRAKGS